jgi:uncharacterized protein YdeI (YjbR/CyaY-like superfamily)
MNPDRLVAPDFEEISMEPNQKHFTDRDSWRAWLEGNFESCSELWLVFFKKHTGKQSISYDAAVEEALCFGWIDSLIKRLDEDRFARKFTPRTDATKWSASNLKRVEKLKAEGRMTEAGLAKLDPSVKPIIPPSKTPVEVPSYFRDALAENDEAGSFFEQLAPSYRRHFVLWVDSAKREETRNRRLTEAITLLSKKQKLGMK